MQRGFFIIILMAGMAVLLFADISSNDDGEVVLNDFTGTAIGWGIPRGYEIVGWDEVKASGTQFVGKRVAVHGTPVLILGEGVVWISSISNCTYESVLFDVFLFLKEKKKEAMFCGIVRSYESFEFYLHIEKVVH